MNVGASSSGITGTFSSVVVDDPSGSFAGFGLQVLYTSSTVQLKVVSAGSGASFASAVPEPTSIALIALVVPLIGCARGCRKK